MLRPTDGWSSRVWGYVDHAASVHYLVFASVLIALMRSCVPSVRLARGEPGERSIMATNVTKGCVVSGWPRKEARVDTLELEPVEAVLVLTLTLPTDLRLALTLATTTTQTPTVAAMTRRWTAIGWRAGAAPMVSPLVMPGMVFVEDVKSRVLGELYVDARWKRGGCRYYLCDAAFQAAVVDRGNAPLLKPLLRGQPPLRLRPTR